MAPDSTLSRLLRSLRPNRAPDAGAMLRDAFRRHVDLAPGPVVTGEGAHAVEPTAIDSRPVPATTPLVSPEGWPLSGRSGDLVTGPYGEEDQT